MKVSLFGDVLNLSFLLGLYLRRKGHDARVFVSQGAFEQFRPEWECADGREMAALPLSRVDVDVKRLLVGGRAERRLRAELADADVVQTFGEDVIWSAGCGAPDTVLSVGDDLDILPFRRDSVRITMYAALLRRAQRRSSAVCYTMPPQEQSCRTLRLDHARFLPCAIPIDADRLAPLGQAERAAVRERLGIPADTLVIFQPSRQEWRCPESPGSNHKGNDRLLRAIARFVQSGRRRTLFMAVTKGNDVAASQELAAQLGISEYVRWIPAQNKHGLREILGISDIVADQFTYGFYGISCLEAMAVGCPVLVYLDAPALARQGVEPPPVVSVRSEADIFQALCDLADDLPRARDLGIRARQWVIAHHGWEPVVDRYLAVYRAISGAAVAHV